MRPTVQSVQGSNRPRVQPSKLYKAPKRPTVQTVQTIQASKLYKAPKGPTVQTVQASKSPNRPTVQMFKGPNFSNENLS